MIRFSKKEDYAIFLVNELVLYHKKRLVPLSEIAQKHTLSLLFLRNIASDLRRAGIIQAVEGKTGGYRLTKHPHNIQVGHVLKSLSSEPIYSCCQETKDGRCHTRLCPHGPTLRRLHNEFIEKVAKLTLLEFVKNT